MHINPKSGIVINPTFVVDQDKARAYDDAVKKAVHGATSTGMLKIALFICFLDILNTANRKSMNKAKRSANQQRSDVLICFCWLASRC